jgi:hypothetical protein
MWGEDIACFRQESVNDGCTIWGRPRGNPQGNLTARLKYYEAAWWCEECLRNRDEKPSVLAM